MIDLPPEALSVRQPWAWAIMHAGKHLENRGWSPRNPHLPRRGRFAIHASKGMTRDEYTAAREHMERFCGITCPAPADLPRGGIVGSVEVAGIIHKSDSPWFFGPLALVLREPEPCAVIPAAGQLGFFKWYVADRDYMPPPAPWMRAAHPLLGEQKDAAT